MKFLKIGIRFWITLTSMLSFVAGWVILGHAPKPSQASSAYTHIAAPLPTLEPLRPLSDFESGEEGFENQPLFGVQPGTRSQFRPAFRTGGS